LALGCFQYRLTPVRSDAPARRPSSGADPKKAIVKMKAATGVHMAISPMKVRFESIQQIAGFHPIPVFTTSAHSLTLAAARRPRRADGALRLARGNAES
jgi:hypothetical protein